LPPGVVVIFAVALARAAVRRRARRKHLEKGPCLSGADNYEKARVEFQNALQISPVDPEARFEMGVVDEKLGKPREAAQFYQATIDVKPGPRGRPNQSREAVSCSPGCPTRPWN
jgi:tetratricopeptide (TPR) repeat protein